MRVRRSGQHQAADDLGPQEEYDDVIGYVPGYAIPSISSLLPTFTNSEQDFINRTFTTGNYDYIKHLPDDIKHQHVGPCTCRAHQRRTDGRPQPQPGTPLHVPSSMRPRLQPCTACAHVHWLARRLPQHRAPATLACPLRLPSSARHA